MSRRVAQSLHIFLASLMPARGWPIGAWLQVFGVGVDVAELSPKADLQTCVAAGVILFSITAQTRLCTTLHELGNACAAAVRAEDPPPSLCHAYTPSTST